MSSGGGTSRPSRQRSSLGPGKSRAVGYSDEESGDAITEEGEAPRQAQAFTMRTEGYSDDESGDAITEESEPVPSSLAHIVVPILRAADEIEEENPRVAYLCRFTAWEKAHTMDPSSSGRGVREFKTQLMHRLEKEERETQGRLASNDAKEIYRFYEQYCRTNLEEGLQRIKPDEMAKYCQIASVLIDVLKTVSPENFQPEFDKYVKAVEKEKASFSRYNILPLNISGSAQPIMEIPEIKAAVELLRMITNLPYPKPDPTSMLPIVRDLLDWLWQTFGFQKGNVENQREHLILLLANLQMRKGRNAHRGERYNQVIQSTTVIYLMKKVFQNYISWCRYMDLESNIKIPNGASTQQPELLYIGLYLLIWGEASNVRLMPECLCYIFHHMASDLYGKIQSEGSFDPLFRLEGRDDAFLQLVIQPIYNVIQKEAATSKHGTMSHTEWRNYDDLNEYFWSKKCFKQLGWPMDLTADFFAAAKKTKNETERHDHAVSRRAMSKTNFVEVRTFLHLFRSFDRMWAFFIVVFQAMVIIAWSPSGSLSAIFEPVVFRNVLTIFITAAFLNFLQATLELVLNWKAWRSLVCSQMIRYSLKFAVAIGWLIILPATYSNCFEIPTGLVKFFSNWIGNFQSESIYSFVVALYMLPNIFNVLFFIFLPNRRAFERSNSRIVRFLLWWTQPKLYVARGMYEDTCSLLKYTSFWILLLICKLAFSYYVEISPLVGPTRTIIYLGRGDNMRHESSPYLHHALGVVITVWAPIVMVYFMDTQIWYGIFSTIGGGVNRTFSRLGEIQTLGILKSRFEAIPRAFEKNLVPRHSSQSKRHEREEDKILHVDKFSDVWNAFINSLRDEDLISNREKYLLIVPSSIGDTTSFPWPPFLLANKISSALEMAKSVKERDEELIKRINQDPYTYHAVTECYETLLNILYSLIKEPEKEVVDHIRESIEDSIRDQSLLKEFRLDELPGLSAKFDGLLNLLLVLRTKGLFPDTFQRVIAYEQQEHDMIEKLIGQQERDMLEKLSACEELKQDMIMKQMGYQQHEHDMRMKRWAPWKYDMTKKQMEQQMRDTIERLNAYRQQLCDMIKKLIAHRQQERDITKKQIAYEQQECDMLKKQIANGLRDIMEIITGDIMKKGQGILKDEYRDNQLFANLNLDSIYSEAWREKCVRLQLLLRTNEPAIYVPTNLEARRRITFFANSLFMKMPRAPQVRSMMSFSVLTPYFKEEVLFSAEDLHRKKNDGISILSYLQQIYPDEWRNFLERINFKPEDEDIDEWKNFVERINFKSEDEWKNFLERINFEPEDVNEWNYVLERINFEPEDVNEWNYVLEQINLKPEDLKPEDLKPEDKGIYEWNNFLRWINFRPKDEVSLESKMEDICKWASYKGHTLTRTVRGMMYYRTALETQCIQEKTDLAKLDRHRTTSSQEGSAVVDMAKAIADIKFTYVVSCQAYGMQKISKDHHDKARYLSILSLMITYPSLRVAYVDKVEAPTGNGTTDTTYYSVLVKGVGDKYDEEIYRIKLPGKPTDIGEERPENKNHAIIFTRGEALQATDMNQDYYLEEAFKMRNVLEEFGSEKYGKSKPTILGLHKHIFTASVSSLAWFMSNQETNLVTIGQQVLANPLKVRFHHGHSDIYDRLFHITRGGISKASKAINLSEDIFSGFNSTMREGNVTHHEYMQVGKGCDAGINQISRFEAEVAHGNAEQTLSRDIYRLGRRFDFYRMLSLYFTTVGFYFSSMVTVLTVYVFLYGRLYLVMSGLEKSVLLDAHIHGNIKPLDRALASQAVFQLGLLLVVPMFVEVGLEKGFCIALGEFVIMQLQLASVFFTFQLGTKTHFYGRTILHGGAKYRPTGHEFVVYHTRFAEIYRMYSRSHFVKGLELLILLVVDLAYGSSYHSSNLHLFVTFSIWFLVASWLFAPFFFNPSCFEWQKTVDDWIDWRRWMGNRVCIGMHEEESWEAWWIGEQEHLRKTSIRALLLEIILSLRFLIYQYVIVYHMNITRRSRSILVYALSWLVMLAVLVVLKIISIGRQKFEGLLFLGSVPVMVVLFVVCKLTISDVFNSILGFVPTGWCILLIGQACSPLLKKIMLWDSIMALGKAYDNVMGFIIFLPIILLSLFSSSSVIQTRLLFNQALRRGLWISRILPGQKDPRKLE